MRRRIAVLVVLAGLLSFGLLGGQAQAATSRAGKRIEISIAQQRLRAYHGHRLVFETVVSTGKKATPTPRGQFAIQRKSKMLWSTYHVWLPYAMQVHGVSWLHGLPITKDGRVIGASELGRPASAGCIRLSTVRAKWLYGWAPVGTPVLIS